MRPSPCGKSHCGICGKVLERSRPFPTELDLRPVLTPNSYFLPPNSQSAFNNVKFKVLPLFRLGIVPGDAVFAAVAGGGFGLGGRTGFGMGELKRCLACKQPDGVLVLVIRQAAVGDGPGGNLLPHHFAVHVPGFVAPGIAGIQVGITRFNVAVRCVQGFAIDLEQIGQGHVTHLLWQSAVCAASAVRHGLRPRRSAQCRIRRRESPAARKPRLQSPPSGPPANLP